MVEVFKTNVNTWRRANFILDLIHQQFKTCEANFDLDDRDNILRVESSDEYFNFDLIKRLLEERKVQIDFLPETENVYTL
ncbi:MAG: hypothetical protein ABI390_06760 [Daejeonella sp.]